MALGSPVTVLLTWLFLGCICSALSHCFSTEAFSPSFFRITDAPASSYAISKATVFINVGILADPVAAANTILNALAFLSQRGSEVSISIFGKKLKCGPRKDIPDSYHFFPSFSASQLVKTAWDLHFFFITT